MEQSKGFPSPELRDLLRQTFGVKKPKLPKNPAPLPIHEEPQKDRRSIGNPMLSAEAQKIYNPPPPAAPVKPPNQTQNQRGTAAGMSMQGPWGTPQEK